MKAGLRVGRSEKQVTGRVLRTDLRTVVGRFADRQRACSALGIGGDFKLPLKQFS